MPDTFTVFSLGPTDDIDRQEGDSFADNAGALVGLTFGSPGSPLFDNARTFSPASQGYWRGTSDAYDMDNFPSERFTIDGGSQNTFDGTAIYNATITYLDGTTATITAVIFQDTFRNTYLAPETLLNADQIALEAGPIVSITLDSVNTAILLGMRGDRMPWNYVTCYVRGSRILTPGGEICIERLSVGDAVTTRDNGPQTIRWIGVNTVPALGNLAPIRISAGALGANIPARDLCVSRQHRMLLISRIAERMFGTSEVLVPAIKLLGVPGVELVTDSTQVTYYHILLDRHEVIYAEGAPSESFLTGSNALASLDSDTVDELELLFPGVLGDVPTSARPIVRDRRLKDFLDRHGRNAKALVTVPT
jgi:hypothetical protein